MNRRSFIINTAVASAALSPMLSRASNLFSPISLSVGVQLYTMGALMETDPKGTLEKLAKIGIKEVESAGSSKGVWYGYSPKEFAKIVSDTGMTWRSAHVGGTKFTLSELLKMANTKEDSTKMQQYAPMLEKMAQAPNLRDNAQQLADQAAEGGVSYLVCAAYPMKTMDDVKAAVDVFNKSGEACKKAGIQFVFHNHNFEFTSMNGTTPYDYIMNNTDKSLVKSELDLGWASVAGHDPVQIFQKYPGRIPLWHVKDMNKATKEPVEVGAGFIDFKRIFAHRATSGMKHFFIEQDGAPDPLTNIKNSYQKIEKIA
jgi:xylose isomerase-like TIM barrel protein